MSWFNCVCPQMAGSAFALHCGKTVPEIDQGVNLGAGPGS